MTIVYFLVKFEPTTGKSKHVLEVSRRLVQQGVTVHLITNRVRWAGPPEALAHLQIHQLGGGVNQAYLKTRQVAELVNKIQPDVFELHGGLSMTLFARSFAQAVGVPTVVNIHSQPSDLWREWRHLQFVDWFRNRRYVADVDDLVGLTLKAFGLSRLLRHPGIRAVFVPSRQLQRAIGEDARVRYLPSGAQLPAVIPDRHIANAQLTLLFFGRAVMVRGIDTLIRAFERLARSEQTLQLQLLLLDDVDTKRIQTLVSRSPFRNRMDVLVGRQGAMVEFFAQATVAVFPFRSSGCIPEQPLTLIEAMAYGVPVVTCPVGTVGEIIRHGENGLLVSPNRPTELAKAIESLLHDPVQRERLGVAGRATVNERFNWDTIAEQTRLVYEELRSQPSE